MNQWKKVITVLLTMTMLFSLSACSSSTESSSADSTDAAATEETESTEAGAEDKDTEEADTAEEEEEASTDFENWTQVTTSGIVEGEDVVFDVLPDGYNETASEHEGTTTTIHYTTDVYGDGQTYEKFARVYLPYGYDENDTETKYNVIYFQHGHQGSPNEWWDHDMSMVHSWNLVNNIFDPDHQVMEPCIIVCPTYYLEYDEDAYVTADGDSPAGDGQYPDIEANYYLEVVQDLIPAVESQFNVYCEDFSEQGIIDSREHRAWTGYSRGSMCTWYMFHNDLAYFKYWGPMSAPYMSDINDPDSVYTPEELYDYLKEAIDANADKDFFLFGTAGGDGDVAVDVNMAEEMAADFTYLAEQTDTFTFGLDPETDNLYYCQSEFPHLNFYGPYSLANMAKVFFK